MECTTNDSDRRRYNYRVLIAMAFYAVFLVADIWIFRHDHPTRVLAYLLAILPALPIIGILATAGFYLAEVKDEFQRTITIQSMLWSIGGTLAVTTVWGFLESFAEVRHLELIWVFPIFCFFMIISGQLVKLRYR
jgi:hypothetical protein